MKDKLERLNLFIKMTEKVLPKLVSDPQWDMIAQLSRLQKERDALLELSKSMTKPKKKKRTKKRRLK